MSLSQKRPNNPEGQSWEDRSAAFRSQQHQHRVAAQVHGVQAVDFFNVLTGPQLLEKTEARLPLHRERHHPPTVTLAMFLKQALEVDRLCQKAVDDTDCAHSSFSSSPGPRK